MIECFRELTADELDLVSGGDRVYQGQDQRYVYHSGSASSWAGSWGYSYSGGGGGYDSQTPPPPPAQPHDMFKLSGRTDCEIDVAAFDTAVSDLIYASPLAKQLFDAAKRDGYTFDLTHNNTDTDDPLTKVIHWDPFSAIQLRDNNHNLINSYQSSIMGLVHELAHVYSFQQAPHYKMYEADGVTPSPWQDAEEKYVIENFETPIANALNSKFGVYGWNEGIRTNHYGDAFISSTVEIANASTRMTSGRPDCD